MFSIGKTQRNGMYLGMCGGVISSIRLPEEGAGSSRAGTTINEEPSQDWLDIPQAAGYSQAMDQRPESLLDRPVHSARKSSGNGHTSPGGGAPSDVTQTDLPLYWSVVRDLQAGEEARLSETNLGVRPVPLTRVREIHHQIARLLAQGIRPVEISAIVGFSQSRISILQRDPTFTELVSFYKHRQDEIGADITSRLTAMTLDAMAVLHERLADSPEAISNDELQRAINSGLDRIGHSGRQVIDVNFIGPAILSRLKQAAIEEGSGGEVHIRQKEPADQPSKTNPNPTQSGAGSQSPVIDVPDEDIVPGPEPADPLRKSGDAPAESRAPSSEGRPAGGTPI